jgi:hypothetical protein
VADLDEAEPSQPISCIALRGVAAHSTILLLLRAAVFGEDV